MVYMVGAYLDETAQNAFIEQVTIPSNTTASVESQENSSEKLIGSD
jgi:hypothetical protein